MIVMRTEATQKLQKMQAIVADRKDAIQTTLSKNHVKEMEKKKDFEDIMT